jgi:ABC-type multidrug transport system ATPase subunit
MITGMFEPNFGNAWVAGYDIRTSVEKAQLEMGVCPQFDLLWPQLTVEEHLYFYARLKGISRKVIDLKVSKAI